MNPKWQYGVFVSILISAIIIAAFLLLKERLFYLVIAEFVILIAIFFAFSLYSKIFRPIDQIKLGSDALKDHDFTSKMRTTGSPEMNDLINVYNNIIENIRKERVFQQEQHYFLNLLVKALPVGILILDYDDKLSEFNPEAQKMLSLQPDDIGKHVEKIHPVLKKELSKIQINEATLFRIGSNKYYRGLINTFMHRGFSRNFVILEDVSSEIINTEKKSYGKVIRMMAHEVNNSVGAINSILDSLLNENTLSTHETGDYLRIILERNKNLNLFMQNFADVVRIPPPHFTNINLNTLIRHVYSLMETQILNTDISFELLLPESEIFVRWDREQMEQVFINIILNAIQAIEGKGTVTIEVSSSPRRVRVLDTGSGIAPEDVQKLFTPFFSTKPSGQGVGLTMVREILNNHHLNYNLTSGDGVTEFLIKF